MPHPEQIVVFRRARFTVLTDRMLRMEWAEAGVQFLAHGLKGVMTRMEMVRSLVCQVSPAHPVHKDELLAVHIAQTGNRISLRPATFRAEIARMYGDIARLPQVLDEMIAIYAGNAGSNSGRDAGVLALQQAASIL